MIVTAILKFPLLPAFQDLRAQLLSYESQIFVPSQITQTALMTTQYRSQSGFSNSNRNFGQGTSSNNRNRNRNGNHGYGNRSYDSILGPPPSYGCQICKGSGHSADNCPQRYIRPSSSDSLQSAFASLQVSHPGF